MEKGYDRARSDEETDLFCWMPSDALDVLRVFHEYRHALEVCVRMNYTDVDKQICNSTLQITRTFPDPNGFVSTAAGQERTGA